MHKVAEPFNLSKDITDLKYFINNSKQLLVSNLPKICYARVNIKITNRFRSHYTIAARQLCTGFPNPVSE